jgi:hypothetical protein
VATQAPAAEATRCIAAWLLPVVNRNGFAERQTLVAAENLDMMFELKILCFSQNWIGTSSCCMTFAYVDTV